METKKPKMNKRGEEKKLEMDSVPLSCPSALAQGVL